VRSNIAIDEQSKWHRRYCMNVALEHIVAENRLLWVIHSVVFVWNRLRARQCTLRWPPVRYDSYEDERRAERSVRLDKTEGYVVIEGRAYPAKEIVEALAQSGYAEIRAIGDSLMLGRRRITPIFKSRQERAMAALCHGSLAYCCPLSKRCADRDRALEMLGLTAADYEHLKADCHSSFIDASRGLETRQDYSSQQSVPTRTANKPATDWGNGSDDYRRDFDELDSVLQAKQPEAAKTGESRDWFTDQETGHTRSQEGQFPERPSTRPFTDSSKEPSLFEGRKSADRERGAVTSCRTCSSDPVEGLGNLFNQGELSPFMEDSHEEGTRSGFCFSCGRTLREGIKVCPYCGSSK